jgi:alpha-beta hydrolase superfamily lysophospholipase
MKRYLKISFYTFLVIVALAWMGLFWGYNKILKFPSWYHSMNSKSAECSNPDVMQKKFDPSLTKVTLIDIPTDKGVLKAFYYRAVKNRTGKGALLIHGGGTDHNQLNSFAHYLSQKGWDGLAVDLPNHGCSYDNLKGIQYGKTELENFDKFYFKAKELFKVEAFIGSSMGSTIAVLYGFPNKIPVKFVLENPMINLQRIISDQNIYYVPPPVKVLLEWQLLKANSELNLKPLIEYKPTREQKILLMYGTKDRLTPPSTQANEFVEAWKPNVQLEIIDGAWHSLLMLQAPGRVQKLLDDFLMK